MRTILALVWAVLVAAAGLHVAMVTQDGLPLQTDLLALLPSEERNADVQAAKARMAAQVSSRMVILVGHADREKAKAAARLLRDGLTGGGLLEDAGDIPAADAVQRLGQAYFPHRAGLLAEADRRLLAEGRADAIVQRALSQVYGVGGMADGALAPEAIGFVSGHGTATEWGDIAETQATAGLLGPRVPIHSLKSYFGHSLGACGGIEAWLGIEMMRRQWFCPTANLENLDERCAELDYVMAAPRHLDIEYVMSNNFAFGGINTSLILRRMP
jgi:hypothetical protein